MTIRLFSLATILVSTCLCDGARGEEDSTTAADMNLRLAVPRALPVLGQQQVLAARIAYQGQGAREAVVRFSYRSDQQSGRIGEDHAVQLAPGGEEITVRQAWKPERTGEHTLTAQLLFNGRDQPDIASTAAQTVTVVGRRLHFHYWDMHPSLRYVTEGMVNEKGQLGYWADRGVVAQRWRGGIWLYDRHSKNPEDIAEDWCAPTGEGWPGIVIDEFGSGGEADEALGRALVVARGRAPGFCLAAYTVSAGGEQKMRGLREAADRVLVETYCSSGAYGYKGIQDRLEGVLKHVPCARVLPALGLGQWITTPQELSRQLHFTRYNFPQIPGVAMFSEKPQMYPELNEAIRHFYIDAVLRVEVLESGQVRIANIGGDRSPATRVKLRAGDAPAPTIELDVPPLDVGQCREMQVQGQELEPVTEYREGGYVLGPPMPWDKEPAEFRPNATAPWLAAGQIAGSVKETFNSRPELEIEHDRSGKEGYDGNVSAASYAIPATGRRACELRFDLEAVRTWFYGSLRVGLIEKDGDSLLDLSLYRGDYQPGVYASVTVKNRNGVLVNEHIALLIEADKPYRFKARYDPQGVVRVAILDQDGGTLWDTGEIPTYGEATFDRVRFGIRCGEGSKLQWDPDRKAMLLRGTMGPQYVLSAYVDNVEIDCFSPEPAESRGSAP